MDKYRSSDAPGVANPGILSGVGYWVVAGIVVLGFGVGVGIAAVATDRSVEGAAATAAAQWCTTRKGDTSPAPLMLASMDHSQHQSMSGDEHAMHRQMMQRKGYTRSAHDYTLPDHLLLRDSDGSETTLAQTLGTDKPVLLNFIYTTCTTICPVLSATFSQIQRDLGSEAGQVRMVSISIDPDRDTPQQLRVYAQRFGAGPQWRFITGERDNIVEVQKAFDIYRGAKTNHEPVTLMRASKADSWVRIEGIASAGEIISEYNALPKMKQ